MNIFWFFIFVSIKLIAIVKSDDEVYQWDAEVYPNLTSHKQAKFCTGSNRNPPSSICDPDMVLQKGEAILLDQLIDDVKNDSKCLCDSCPPHKPGLNIKIALVKFVKVVGNISIDRSVEMFAERTRRKWRFGDDCSNDVLIFMAALDDKIYLSMGSRARNVLSKEDVQKLLEENRIHFTSGYFHQGLESIIATIQDKAENYTPKKSNLSLGSVILIVVCVFIAIIVVLFVVFWLCIKKDRNSLSGSFEFIGSWGRNKNKNKGKDNRTRVKPKIEPIYKPVNVTEKTITEESEIPKSGREVEEIA